MLPRVLLLHCLFQTLHYSVGGLMRRVSCATKSFAVVQSVPDIALFRG